MPHKFRILLRLYWAPTLQTFLHKKEKRYYGHTFLFQLPSWICKIFSKSSICDFVVTSLGFLFIIATA